LAALLAGVSFGIWIGFNPLHLSQSTYLEQQQNTILSLRVLMISLVFMATLVTVISAFLQKKNKTVFISLIIAALCFIVCIMITKFGNLPIDNVVMTWTLDTMPANWMELRSDWWSFHIMRTIAELTALTLVTWSSVQKLTWVASETS
jgi:hypothetical protein